MSEFLQQLINGLALGAIYALIALGYTMVYGVLRFINFAHGDVFMLGAFAGYFLSPLVNRILPAQSYVGGMLVLVLAMVVCAALGMLIEILAYRPLRQRPKLTVLITAIGVSLLLQNVGQLKPVSESLGIPFGPYTSANPPLLLSCENLAPTKRCMVLPMAGDAGDWLTEARTRFFRKFGRFPCELKSFFEDDRLAQDKQRREPGGR